VIGGLHGSGKSDLLMLAGGMAAPARGEYFFSRPGNADFEGEHLTNDCAWVLFSRGAIAQSAHGRRKRGVCRCGITRI